MSNPQLKIAIQRKLGSVPAQPPVQQASPTMGNTNPIANAIGRMNVPPDQDSVLRSNIGNAKGKSRMDRSKMINILNGISTLRNQSNSM